MKSLATAVHFCVQETAVCNAPVQKHFHDRSMEPQIPGFAREDNKERVAAKRGRLLKERVSRCTDYQLQRGKGNNVRFQ
jgi:hypothetical protein